MLWHMTVACHRAFVPFTAAGQREILTPLPWLPDFILLLAGASLVLPSPPSLEKLKRSANTRTAMAEGHLGAKAAKDVNFLD